jgi:achaete-scute complex protein
MLMAMDNVLVHRKLAPAPDRASVLVHTQDRCKKKINFNHLPYTGPGPQPASVARRNARERNRVKQVNNGFATLRQHIPPAVAATVVGGGRGASKKLSKVDTLKLAVEYIRSLQQLLDDHDSESGSTTDVGYDSRSYYTGSPDPSQSNLINHTPPSSEASVSPTPSFASENSPPVYTHVPKYQIDSYENYEPMSPEDEELLDAIFCWQQQ